jgi:hypothetical protein
MDVAAIREEQIHALRVLPDQVARAVSGLDDSKLDTPYREGSWTIRQVVHHLADAHLNAAVRIRLALTEDHPTVKPYDQDAWAELSDARSHPVEPSIAILRGVHQRLVALFEDLPEEAWERTVDHPEAGDLRVADFLRIYAAHGSGHLSRIEELRERKGW